MLRHVPFRISTNPYPNPNLGVWIRQKSSGGRRPKKKTYHRVPELDRVMHLRKKPSMILHLNSLIQSHHNSHSILLRDLEKHVGFVQKWDFMSLIQRYPTIFRVAGVPPSVSLTAKAEKVAAEEGRARIMMEPLLVNNLRKLLMLCVDCRVPLETLEFVGPELGLPCHFKDSLILKYPQFFTLKHVKGRDWLELQDWDSSLALTAREVRMRGMVLPYNFASI